MGFPAERSTLTGHGQWWYCVVICSRLKHSVKGHEISQLTKTQEDPETYTVHKAPPQGYRGTASAGEWRHSHESCATCKSAGSLRGAAFVSYSCWGELFSDVTIFQPPGS